MILPSDARAHQLGLGLGLVDGDCSILSETESSRCFTGARWELFWNFYGSGGENAGGSGSASASGRSSGGNWFWNTNFGSFGGGNGSADFVIVAFLLSLILLAGVFWAIVYLFSTRTKLGMFYSADTQQVPVIYDGERQGIESYQVEKLGTQISFYPSRVVDLQLYFGLAGATARIRTYERDDGVGTYNLRGIASKAGFGYMPDIDEGGFFLTAEVEGAFYGESALRYSQEARRKVLPQYRRNAAVMLGFVAGW